MNDPDGLAFFYMDTMMCHEFYMKHQDCQQEYNKKWFFSRGRSKLHKECLNHLDKYKACLIGINTDKLISANRHSVSDKDMMAKRSASRNSVKIQSPNQEAPNKE